MMCFGLKDRKRVKTNHCVIVLLDDTQLVHELHHSTSGQDLLDVVIKHLNLLETSYFGLKYEARHQDANKAAAAAAADQQRYGYSGGASDAAGRAAGQQMVWLDVNKSAIKQLSDVQPMIVHFAVKYYAADPCKLAEEITRYQFFLQCKQDILHGRLPVPFELAVELLALAVQSELGDFDPQRHADNYVSEFQFVPHQTAEMERRAALYHRQLTGQVPATAELNFLERIKWLDLYGCELHPIQYNDHDDDLAEANQFALGLGPMGVLVLRSRHKVAQYAWPRIVKTKCQGRCFLMDVVVEQPAGGKQGAAQRSRFGFRLRDKLASQRLRWSLEEHKSFFHLIHSSTSLQQLAQAQKRHQQATLEREQQLKFSQRFRNSIRSAIGFSGANLPGEHFSQKLILQHQQQLAAAAQQQQQQKQLLRSSIKSTAARQQPTVVRMPSRRYNSNRSLPRPQFAAHHQQQPQQHGIPSYQANGLALPAQQSLLVASPQQHHTMVDSRRQQALMMMNQFNQMNTPIARSQTLKPASSREAKRNPYYQMMLMYTAQQHQAQLLQAQQQQQLGPEVSILPPGQHIVQPSIYKASSVINGINQLGKKPADLILCQQQQQTRPGVLPPPPLLPATMGQQLFSGKPRYHHGHESPRSTKSAMAPSSALKLASKKLAKQQQLIYGNQADLLPLLAGKQRSAHYSASSAEYYDEDNITLARQLQRPPPPPLPYSANASPRSTRSARLSTARQQSRSKSTGENLHLLHKQQQQQSQFIANNRMLLATAAPVNQQQLMSTMLDGGLSVPPPDYNLGDQQQAPLPPKHKPSFADARAKRAAFITDSSQANLLLNNNNQQQQRRRPSVMSDDDDYYCSRSDCSSIDNNNAANQAHRRRPQNNNVTGQPARYFANGQSIAAANLQRDNSAAQQQQDWNSIKRRHEKGMLLSELQEQHNNDRDTNNNNQSANQRQYSPPNNNLVKNIPNKQATPILLSMSYTDNKLLAGQMIDAANNKAAVKLLNLQRQQLNSQSSSEGSCGANKTGGTTGANESGQLLSSCSAASSSASSSAVSSPKAQTQLTKSKMGSTNAADSTGSNSTTSGYYAGSNSTGPTSVDSDTISAGDSRSPPSSAAGQRAGPQQYNNDNSLDDWRQRQEANGRAKMAYGAGTRTAGGAIDSSNRFIIGNPQKLLNSNQQKINGNSAAMIGGAQSVKTKEQPREYQKQQQHFYLGETNNHSDDSSKSQTHQAQTQTGKGSYRQQQWSPLEQIQQHSTSSSLKYVSFDV